MFTVASSASNLVNHWFVIGNPSTVVRHQLIPIKLLGVDLVLWRDSNDQFHLWLDLCPHRGMKLSLGSICEDQVICPYHGWNFSPKGKCTLIPSLPQLSPAHLKGQVKTFHVQIQYGLIWACLGDDPIAFPLYPEFALTGRQIVQCGPYELATSGPRIIENFLDMAHFPFVHEGILGDKNQMQLPDYEVGEFMEASYGAGIRATKCYSWQPKASKNAQNPELIEYTYRVIDPFIAILNKKLADWQAINSSPEDAISLFLQPIEPTLTRAWITMVLCDSEHTEQELREFQDHIFGQDQAMIENQSPKLLPISPEKEVSVVTDRLSIAYRKYLKSLHLQYGVINE